MSSLVSAYASKLVILVKVKMIIQGEKSNGTAKEVT